jgi:hypothetical protein
VTPDDGSADEIELLPANGRPDPAVGDRPTDAPQRSRRVALIAAAIVTAAAIAIGVIVLAGADDDSTAAPTTGSVETDGPADVAVGDLDVLPLPELDPPPTGSIVAGRSPLTVATYPPVAAEEATDVEIGPRDLRAAVRAATIDQPLRTTTRVEIGDGGFRSTTVITSDPDAGRYRIEIGGDLRSRRAVVVDTEAGLATFLEIDDDRETVSGSVPDEDLADELDAPDVRSALRPLMLGPVRSDTLGAATAIELDELVDLDGSVARRFDVDLPVGVVREWVPYRLAPAGEAAPLGDGTTVTFDVHVSQDRRIVLVTGAQPYGATVQRIVHTIELLDAAPRIELPDEP